MYPKQREGLTIQVVGDETVVLDQTNDKIHQLNATASLILERCDGVTSDMMIANELTQRYAVDQNTVVRDVHRTIEQLKALDLVY